MTRSATVSAKQAYTVRETIESARSHTAKESSVMSKVFAALFFKKDKNRLTFRPGFPVGFSFSFDAVELYL